MKNLILFTIMTIMTLSCSSTSKMTADSEKLMRGDWLVTSVMVDGVNENAVKVTVFDQADSKCFEGSMWHLVQNNATGTYTLNAGGDCPSGAMKIKWFITEENGQMYFNFKKVYDGERPKNVVDGYKLRVSENSGNNFTLVQDLMFEGKPISVFYKFQKILNK